MKSKQKHKFKSVMVKIIINNIFTLVFGVIILINSLNTLPVLAAPILDIASTLVSSGTAPFDVDDSAGNDSNNTNNIVRTIDSFIIKYDYSANGENAINAYINIDIPTGILSMSQSQLPPACKIGSTVSNQFDSNLPSVIRCVIGDVTAGTTSSFFITFYNQSNNLPTPNGAIFSIIPSFFANGSNVIGLSTQIVSSSQPKSDLLMVTPTAVSMPGPLGEPGYVVSTELRRSFRNRFGSPAKLLDETTTDYKFDIVYPNTGGPYSGGRLYTWGTTQFACTNSSIQINNCSQPGGQGASIIVDNIGTYMAEIIKVWIPASDIQAAPAQSLNLSILASNYDPNGIDGSSNYGVSIEPLFNNIQNLNLQIITGSTFRKSTVFGPIVLIGSDVIWNNTLTNTGNTFQLNNALVCDKIDINTQVFKSSFASTSSVIEYATSQNTPDNQTATCEDADGPWFSSIGDVPGGVVAITKTRVKNTAGIPPNQNYNYSVTTTIKPTVNNGNTILNYGSAKTDLSPNYANSTASVIASLNDIYINLLTPNTTQSVGDLIEYRITARTDSYVANQNTTNTIIDTLPASLSYEPGSANVTPDSVIVNPDNTTTITWTYQPIFPPNVFLTSSTYINFFARVKTSVPSNTNIVNRANISNPTVTYQDINSLRTSTATTNILNTSTFFIENTANQSYILPNQAFSYNIRYGNLTTNTISNIDLVDILPYNGDGLTPATNYTGTLSFSGITVNNGGTVLYTKTPFNSISPDPCNPSNIALGQTSPVCNSGIVGTGVTVWCSSPSGGSCPANNSEITATRVKAQNLAPNSSRIYTIEFTPVGNVSANVYANRVIGRATNLALVVYSNSASAMVSLGSITGKIWNDVDQNGLINNSEAGIANVPVTLNQIVGANSSVVATINTNPDGEYIFSNLNPGNYSVTVSKPAQTAQTYDLDGLSTPNLVENQNIVFSVSAGSSNLIRVNFGYSNIVTPPSTPPVNNGNTNSGTTIIKSLNNAVSVAELNILQPQTTNTQNVSQVSYSNSVETCPLNSNCGPATDQIDTKATYSLVRTGSDSTFSYVPLLSFLIILAVGILSVPDHKELQN